MQFTKLFITIFSISTAAAAVIEQRAAADLYTNGVFSFEKWAISIIADKASALSVPEAVRAYEASINATKPSAAISLSPPGPVTTVAPGTPAPYKFPAPAPLAKRSLEKRWSCYTGPPWANVADAAGVVSYVASKAGQWCEVYGSSVFASGPNAYLIGISNGGYAASDCNDVARAGGIIMDNCIQGPWVQGNEYAWGNGNLAVHLAGY